MQRLPKKREQNTKQKPTQTGDDVERRAAAGRRASQTEEEKELTRRKVTTEEKPGGYTCREIERREDNGGTRRRGRPVHSSSVVMVIASARQAFQLHKGQPNMSSKSKTARNPGGGVVTAEKSTRRQTLCIEKSLKMSEQTKSRAFIKDTIEKKCHARLMFEKERT